MQAFEGALLLIGVVPEVSLRMFPHTCFQDRYLVMRSAPCSDILMCLVVLGALPCDEERSLFSFLIFGSLVVTKSVAWNWGGGAPLDGLRYLFWAVSAQKRPLVAAAAPAAAAAAAPTVAAAALPWRPSARTWRLDGGGFV